MTARTVLFLCTGNSGRSQMAEAIVNARLSGQWLAFSAGTRPAGHVHPQVVAALEEIGIRHEGRSKSVEEFHNSSFDLVVTLCDPAAEDCPIWLGKGTRAHHSYPDPAQMVEMKEFRALRESMLKELPDLLGQHRT